MPSAKKRDKAGRPSMGARTQTIVRLPLEVFELLKKKAEEEELSLNAYMVKVLSKAK